MPWNVILIVTLSIIVGLFFLVTRYTSRRPPRSRFGFVEAGNDTYTDKNGVVHKQVSLIGENGVTYDGYYDTQIFREQSFHVERSIQIGQSDLYFCVNDKLDRFALGIPEYPTTMRFYDVSNIRKFEIVDDEAYSSSGYGYEYTDQTGHSGHSSSSGNVYTFSVILYIYMNDIHEPHIQLQFLRKQKVKSSTARYEAVTSAREVKSLLELLTDRNRG